MGSKSLLTSSKLIYLNVIAASGGVQSSQRPNRPSTHHNQLLMLLRIHNSWRVDVEGL